MLEKWYHFLEVSDYWAENDGMIIWLSTHFWQVMLGIFALLIIMIVYIAKTEGE